MVMCSDQNSVWCQLLATPHRSKNDYRLKPDVVRDNYLYFGIIVAPSEWPRRLARHLARSSPDLP